MTSASETVAAILVEKFRVNPQEIRPEEALASLDMDSLAVVELLFALEQELGVRIGEDEVTPRHTLQELVAMLESKLEQRSSGEGQQPSGEEPQTPGPEQQSSGEDR